MRNVAPRSFYLAATVLVCCATAAFADVSMQLTGVNSGYVMGGVYTSPYSITVGGTPMLLICDDFTTNISLGYSWSASTTSLTDLQGRARQAPQ